MHVRYLGVASDETWLEIARRCPYATYFHTPAWARLMTFAHPELAIASQHFRTRDGTDVVLPLVEYRVGRMFRAYESMVPGVYGGPIAERPLTSEEVEEILESIVTARVCRLRVFGNPFLQFFCAPPGVPSEFTHIIDLRGGFDAVFHRFHQNHRRSYRYALERGLTVHRAESLADVREYFAVYQADRKRWGSRASTDDPLRLFEEIQRRADPNVVLWLARLDSRVVAGDLWLYWNDHNVGWHGAADPDFFHTFPTNYLLTEIIRDACNRGARCVDLNPSGANEGVVRFKDSFGAKRVFFRHADRPGSRWYRASRLLGRRLARARSLLFPESASTGGAS